MKEYFWTVVLSSENVKHRFTCFADAMPRAYAVAKAHFEADYPGEKITSFNASMQTSDQTEGNEPWRT